MLLTAAKMLKERESELRGTVKFMFQPAEETFEGANDMAAHGILENPRPDAALAFHVAAGNQAPGMFYYNNSGAMMFSVDGFRITIHGKGAHGAYPQQAVDPINIAVHCYLALEALIAREADPEKMCVLTVGKFQAGAAPNIIPEIALLEGTIRTNDPGSRKKLVRRMKETAEMTAKVYGGTARVTMTSGVPPLICDKTLTDKVVNYLQELNVPNAMGQPGITSSASEDFATVAQEIPGCFVYLSAGFPDQRGSYPAHNPKVRFNEEVCAIGAAAYAHCAFRWLEDQTSAGTKK
jgi:amidohydrolase